MARTVAEMLVATFVTAGAKRCYGLPGDTLNLFTDAVRRSSLRFVHVRHEEVGGFAAGADALLSDQLAICAGSCGPGSLHFINGLFDAHRNRAPVVLVASQLGLDVVGNDFPQEVDFRPLYAQASVFCEEIRTPEAAPRIAAMAAQAALNRRGLAVIILPSDIARAKVAKAEVREVHHPRPVIVPAAHEIETLAKMIDAGERITIYGGSGCRAAGPQVIELARRLAAPVAYTSRAKDFLEPDNPFAAGMTGMFGVESGFHAVRQCDTLLLLGCDFAWTQYYPEGATILQIDSDPTHLGRRHPVNLGLVGDVSRTLDLLMDRVRTRSDTSFLSEVLDVREHATRRLRKHAGPEGEAIHPQYLTEILAELAEPDAIWTADGGTPMVWLLRHVPATGRNRTLLSLTHGSMANAMPYALGAAAAVPDRQVISLCGDGGLAMLMGDLLTTVQERLPIKIVVYNNSSLAFVELEQKVEGLLNSYTDLKNPDFGSVARAVGFWGRRVEHASELHEAVREFLSQPGPALLDVSVDRYELVVPPHVTLGNVAGTALYSARAILSGRAREVEQLITHNLPL